LLKCTELYHVTPHREKRDRQRSKTKQGGIGEINEVKEREVGENCIMRGFIASTLL
jgi:hypothetical protein